MSSGAPPTRDTIYTVSQRDLWRPRALEAEDENRPLPSPTRDLARLKRDLDVHGYCLVADVLNSLERAALRERLEQQWEAEARLGIALANPTGVHSLSNLLNKGAIFQKVVLQPVIEDLLEHMLGDGYLISAINSHQTVPGSKAQGLHIDQFLFGLPTEMPLVGNAFFLIDDFTEENGATRIIPGSHRWPPERVAATYQGLDASNDGENPLGTIPAEAPAGCCFVFEGRLLHGAGKNLSKDKVRTGITSYYCRPWMRPFENALLSIPEEVAASFTPALRAQLGYEPWGLAGGYQVAGGRLPEGVLRPMDPIGELR